MFIGGCVYDSTSIPVAHAPVVVPSIISLSLSRDCLDRKIIKQISRSGRPATVTGVCETSRTPSCALGSCGWQQGAGRTSGYGRRRSLSFSTISRSTCKVSNGVWLLNPRSNFVAVSEYRDGVVLLAASYTSLYIFAHFEGLNIYFSCLENVEIAT